MSAPALRKRITSSARIDEIANGWRLSLPSGGANEYRLAQLDDYTDRKRSGFPHRQGLELLLRAKASHPDLPGTWGFGFWNDPFGFSLGFGGTKGRLPALPNAAWFFFASHQSHLSLRDDQPGSGALIGAYRSPRIPSLALLPSALAAPLLLLPAGSRLLRRLASRTVKHDLRAFKLDPTKLHEYKLLWSRGAVEFFIDGTTAFTTEEAPQPPLGLVLWLDNQFAAWQPDGRLSYGTLATPPDCWVEITDLHLSTR